jgi:hypothetical protein
LLPRAGRPAERVLVEVAVPVLLPPDRWDFRLVDF